MKIAEEDGYREEHDVAWLSSEETNQLDEFGEREHKYELRPKRLSAGLHIPSFRAPPKRKQQERVNNEGNRRKGGEVQGIRAPRLLTM
jgi:hypothetical protein